MYKPKEKKEEYMSHKPASPTCKECTQSSPCILAYTIEGCQHQCFCLQNKEKCFFGYFDPEKFFSNNENKKLSGCELNDNSATNEPSATNPETG